MQENSDTPRLRLMNFNDHSGSCPKVLNFSCLIVLLNLSQLTTARSVTIKMKYNFRDLQCF
jgi:hypothetical protein